MELTAESWSERYLTFQTPWDIGYVSTPVQLFVDTISDHALHILVPGGGNGYEAEYLWHKGFHHTYLLDWSRQPLDTFAKKVPVFPPENLLEKDFFQHTGQYDLLIEQTFFCAIDPSLRIQYALKAHELLKPGGRLVGLLFDDRLNNDHPPFGGSRQEYEALFSPLFHIHKMERCYNSIPPRAGRELFINLVKN